MGNTLPHDALWSEVAAWPLASEAAFRQRVVTLELSPGLMPHGATAHLWEALEAELRHRGGRDGLAALLPLRDELWFVRGAAGLVGGARSLAAYLGHVAGEVLVDDGGACRLRVESFAPGSEMGGAARAAQRWRWLSARLPPSLLLAGLAWQRGSTPRARVDLLPGHVERLLRENPVAELHLHVGAGPDYEALWAALMSAPNPRPLDGDAPLGPQFQLVLMAASFVRRLLLMHAAAPLARRTLNEIVREHACDVAAHRGWRTIDCWRDALGILGEFGADQGSAGMSGSALVDERGRGSLSRRAAWLRRALERFGPVRSATPHATLVQTMLSLVERPDCDPHLRRVFWQYVRTHALLYRFLVNDPASCGLDWFSRHYGRISGITAGDLREHRFRHTLANDGAGVNLACLELRTAPDASWEAMRREVRGYARDVARLGRVAPEWGVVFHLIKSAIVDGARVDVASPHGRYATWFRRAREQVRALKAMLTLEPDLLQVVRGIDVANVELTVPTWIVAPLFREALRPTPRARPAQLPLRTTPHVGEDFRRLAEGLRRLDEALALELVGRGSRVGHALALGIDPRRWGDHRPIVSQPLEERLFDLLWEKTLAERGLVRPTAARTAYVAAEARRLGQALFGQPVPVDDLVAAYRDLLRPGRVMQVGYGRAIGVLADRDYVRRWLFDGRVQRRGAAAITVVTTDDEVDMLQEAQLAVARAYVNAGVAVECNLSSNLLVGGLASFAEHPMLRWQPLIDAPNLPRIGITLNSDDPVTFATRLADEYAYAYFALLHVGATNEQALDWVERVRRMGWLARFTLPSSRDPVLMRRLAGRFN